jgi:phosphate transport system substrate-binding protein
MNRRTMKRSYWILASLVIAGCAVGAWTMTVRAQAKKAIQNRGSDTMIELAQAWAEDYKGADVEVSGGGSGVGISALIDGKVDIANASRLMTDKEIADAKAKSGKEPKLYVVGYDALAIYVKNDNPLEEISTDQLKDIYGDGGKVSSWAQLNVKNAGCSGDKIVLVSRQNNSGTYEYFREHILGKEGKYKLGTIDQSGSKDVVALVGKTPCAIGYSGMGYKTDAVKFLKVKSKDGKAVLPSIENVYNKSYPISRPLFMYTLGEATGQVKAYIDWTRSDAGQAVLEKIGYVPLKAAERVKAASSAGSK